MSSAISYWLGPQSQVLLQVDDAVGVPECYVTRLIPKPGASVGRQPSRVRLRQGDDSVEVQARRLAVEDLATPDGAAGVPAAVVKAPSDEVRSLVGSVLDAMFDNWTPAFQGSPVDGHALGVLIAGLLGLKSASYTIAGETQLRDLLGDSRIPQTMQTGELYQFLHGGGVYLVNVPKLSPALARVLTVFMPFLRGRDYDIMHLGFPEDFTIHPDFHLVFNFPDEEGPLPPELAGNLHFVRTEPGCAGVLARPVAYKEIQSGPGTVLVLMKFNIPAYEGFFATTIEPLVQQFVPEREMCVRITKGMDEWRTEMRRVLERADAVLVDVSHDLTVGLSPNVIWELTQLYREMIDRKLKRSRVLCFCRGLGDGPARDDPNFLYSADMNPAWVPLVGRSTNVDDLLGLRIRKYDPADRGSVAGLCEWIGEALSVWVQGVPAPITDEDLRGRAADMLRRSKGDAAGAAWIRAIRDQDVGRCAKLARAGPPTTKEHLDLLGCLLATVSVSKAAGEPSYWQLVKLAVADCETLRKHFLRLLGTQHLQQRHWATNHFRENLWYSLRRAKLPATEVDQLRERACAEADPDIRLVAQSVLIDILPDAEREDARDRAIEGFYGVELDE